MTTPELISYIRKQIQNNIPKDLILSSLLDVGWHLEDINEGFLSSDLYHEPLEGSNLFEIKKELPKVEINKVEIAEIAQPVEKKKEVSKIWVPIRVPVKEKAIEIQELELPAKKEEPRVYIAPKNPVSSFDSISKNNLQSNPSKNISEVAMLASYKSDLLSVTKKKEEIVKEDKPKNNKWKIIISLIILVLVLVSALFATGFIGIKNLSIFSVKKDPKILLLNNSKILSSLKSYKTETNINIILSYLGNDFVSINTLGMMEKNEQGFLSDNFITIKGSLLKDYITTDVKNNGSELFISVPDLSQITENAPKPSILKINQEESDMVTSLLGSKTQIQFGGINLYKVLSEGISSYIDNSILAIYDNLINSIEIVEKGEEVIKGIDTYHYSINANTELSKNLLNKIANNFTLNMSDDEKNRIDQILTKVIINSFDIWIGKGDNNIYQYNIVLDVPIPQIVESEDESIVDNKIKVTWNTTYYDFDVSNNISIPKDFIQATDFVNNFKTVDLPEVKPE